jgi:nitroreductase
MWDFFETVRHRHSIRKYQSDMPIEQEKLHAILEMACAAPSAGDQQAYHIIAVSKPEEINQLSEASCHQKFMADAPLCLVFCSDSQRSAEKFGERGAQLYALQDTTIAASYAQLATVAAGLSSAWVGDFDEQQVKDLLGIAQHLRPVAIIAIGYPAELPEPSPRRPMKEVVTQR